MGPDLSVKHQNVDKETYHHEAAALHVKTPSLALSNRLHHDCNMLLSLTVRKVRSAPVSAGNPEKNVTNLGTATGQASSHSNSNHGINLTLY